jgi:hypothetical protein
METTGLEALGEARQRLEDALDRLLLSGTRLTMALERSEASLGRLRTALADLDGHVEG